MTIGPLGTVDVEDLVSGCDGLNSLPGSEDNETFTGFPSHPSRWTGSKSIGLPGVDDLEGRVTMVKTDLRDPSTLGYKRVLRKPVV